MRFNQFYLLLCLLVQINFSAFSQNNISFGVDGVSHEDTLYIGDTIHFNFWLINQSMSVLTDSLSIHCETFDDLGISISSMSIGSYYNISSLAAGDSLFITISELVSYQSYVLGDNIVVIWPALVGSGNVDTSMTNVYIIDSMMSEIITKDNFNDEVLFYPNPVDMDLIYFDSEYLISHIRIIDIYGRIIYSYSSNNHFQKVLQQYDIALVFLC